MAKRRKRRARFVGRHGKTVKCRTMTASDCGVKISGRKYKARKSCPTGKITVCPFKRGRKTTYKVSTPDKGSTSLYKVPRKKRR